jgi:uncharacterized protein (TIGR02246 family)
MTDDERAIRQVIETWMAATKRRDLAAVLTLMTDDVMFMVPAQEPFGKEAFVATWESMRNMQIEATGEILELQVLGDWAFIRNRLDMTVTPPDGNRLRRSGYTLTLLRKDTDDQWRLARDANLVTTRN